MEHKIYIKDLDGKVLFSYSCKDNTIKKTAENAVKEGVILDRADFKGADLRGVNFKGADLFHANFTLAKLNRADFNCSVLKYCDFSRAGLFMADFSEADCRFCCFYNSDIQNATFKYCPMNGCCFMMADMRETEISFSNVMLSDFDGADLRFLSLKENNLDYCNFHNSNLEGAYFYRSSLFETNLISARNIPNIPMGLPCGEFIGWKKLSENLIVKLKILSDSKRSRAGGTKCRCDKALVMEFQNTNGTTSEITKYESDRYAPCTYKVGDIVYADSWDENRWNECSHGIHFFIDRDSAVDFTL
jgi:uncharacterized protein YjbI with pentapeptide repeats